MREVKFRAWDKKTSKMRYLDEHLDFRHMTTPKYENQTIDLSAAIRYSELIELMQYTGLKDKNGREIYEGDTLADERGYKAVVTWYQPDATLQLVDVEEYVRGRLDEEAYIINTSQGWVALEIVGNTHENPELLGDNSETL